MAKSSREQDRELRRLNAELGIGQGHGVRGLLLGTALIAAIFAAGAFMFRSREDGAKVQGYVHGFSVRPSDTGDYPVARVYVDSREAFVPLPRSHRCHFGDRIDLVRHKVLAGNRYALGPMGCWRSR